MRRIVKGKESNTLTRHRQTDHANYDNYHDNETLRRFLFNEQRGICCYCLSPIRPERGAMKIEHFRSQKRYPDEQLVYRNLLGACMGNEGQPRSGQHCDTRKAEDDLSRSPADPDHPIENFVRFGADGSIISADAEFDRELNEVLNLNVAFLKNNRKAALDGFIRSITNHAEFQRATLERWLADWNGESHSNNLRPYCQVVVYWIRKRLERA